MQQERGLEKKTTGDVLRMFLWNSGGLGFYLLCKWSLTIIVVRLSTGFDDAGYLALAMSITNLLYCFAIYGVRSYQVSDINNEHTINTYVTSRLITVIAAQLCCILFCIFYYGLDKRSIIVILYMILMSGEALSDVFQGAAQKHWRMDIVGLSFLFRGILLISAFVIFYLISGLTTAVMISSVLTLLVIYFYDIKQVRKIEAFRLEFNRERILNLLKVCFPLMTMALLHISFVSVARIAVENTFGISNMGIFNSATLPAAILYNATLFVFAPFVNILSLSFSQGDIKRFGRQILYVFGIIIALVLIAVLISETMGGFLLSLLFGQEIYNYSYLLTEALIVTGVASLLWFIGIVLTVMRKLTIIMIGFSTGFICSLISMTWVLENYGMSGANYMQFIGFGISLLILLVAYCVYMRNIKKDFNA